MTNIKVIELFDDFKRFVYDKNDITCDEFLFISGLIDEWLYTNEDTLRFKNLEEMDNYLEDLTNVEADDQQITYHEEEASVGGWGSIKDIKPNREWHNMEKLNLSPVKDIINKIKEAEEKE